MQRRTFIEKTGLFAIGMGAFGSVSWREGEGRFIGDSPTTTDILGPWYRPGAPFKKNLNPAGFNGEILRLSGTVFNEDGKTPMNDCLIEIWQCDRDGLYDNTSDAFIYRASQRVKANGLYSFVTGIPVPYPTEADPTQYRPAHIHMRISAEGQQDLITQLYFKGDPNLETDPSTKSPLSVNRILPLTKIRDNESELRFDVVLGKQYRPDDAVFHKVSGIYKMSDNSMMEFYRDGDLLFYKRNNQISGGLSYRDANTFIGGVNDTEAAFELAAQGNATVRFRFSRRRETRLTGTKLVHYNR
jgi:protocatechuate 3,4-dioxygenase beta subunit